MWQSLDSFSRAPWWSSYACNINARKHRKATEVPGGLLLLLKRSTFSSISHYVFRGFPNTVMGARSPVADMPRRPEPQVVSWEASTQAETPGKSCGPGAAQCSMH